jgi:hypothetical protein
MRPPTSSSGLPTAWASTSDATGCCRSRRRGGFCRVDIHRASPIEPLLSDRARNHDKPHNPHEPVENRVPPISEAGTPCERSAQTPIPGMAAADEDARGERVMAGLADGRPASPVVPDRSGLGSRQAPPIQIHHDLRGAAYIGGLTTHRTARRDHGHSRFLTPMPQNPGTPLWASLRCPATRTVRYPSRGVRART